MALRADKQGAHRVAFDKNRKRLLKTENVCGICGKPINKKLKAPDPMSPVVDHIIPINKGGHPSAIENLQLAHWTCNRQKSDKLFNNKKEEIKVIGNRNLPKSLDWTLYSGEKEVGIKILKINLKALSERIKGAYFPHRWLLRTSRSHCTFFLARN